MSAVAEPRSGTRRRVVRALQITVSLGLAASLLIWGLPYFAKTEWSAVFDVLGGIHPLHIVGLLVLEVLGLWLYTFTLTGSLPGLAHWRALVVNVCGSSVGNLLPGGGAVGLAATYTILRSWGFKRRDISTSAIVTGVWNTLARVALPLIGIVVLLIGDETLPRAAKDAAVVAAVSGGVLLTAFVAIISSAHAAQWIGAGLDRLIRPLWTRFARGRPMAVRELVIDLRARITDVVRTGWLSMTFGMVGFFGTYFLLFWACLAAVDVALPLGMLFAAYAIGRLLTAVGVTPGGLGVTETGTAAVLVGMGASPAEATAGVVLFSIFTHVMEVPLGALGWLAWTALPREDVTGDEGASVTPTPA